MKQAFSSSKDVANKKNIIFNLDKSIDDNDNSVGTNKKY